MLDVAIIGGSFAGLSAALQLGRASRSVMLFDEGRPRNRRSPAAHGVPGWDGVPPEDILTRFRADLDAYSTVRRVTAGVGAVRGEIDRFTVDPDGPEPVVARRLILAHGVRDTLAALPGLTAGWGRTVLHCPYCHGYEVKGRSLAVLATGPMAAHQALMLRADWSDDVTLLINGVDGLDLPTLTASGVTLEHRRPVAVAGTGEIDVRFATGPGLRFAAVFATPAVDLSGSPAERLGLGLSDGPMGPFVRVGPMQQTDMPGVFAAGDLATPMWNVASAVADGVRAGTGAHQSLLFPNFVPTLEKETA